jgi:hypothetical protein
MITSYVTSVDVLAKRAGLIDAAFNQLAAGLVVKTADDKVLYGVRGGKSNPTRTKRFASRMFGFFPGGSVTFKPEYDENPIADTLRHEAIEEMLGTGASFGIHNIRPMGIFYVPVQENPQDQRGPDGFKPTFYGETDATLAQVQSLNFRANERRGELIAVYTEDIARSVIDTTSVESLFKQLAKVEAIAAAKADAELKKEGLPWNSWEHENMYGLPWDPVEIERHIRDNAQLHSGLSIGTMKLLAEFISRQ